MLEFTPLWWAAKYQINKLCLIDYEKSRV